MDDCIFCKIAKGEIPSYKIYEDEKVIVFLDINPLSKGHSIVIPKEHYVNILDLPEELYLHMSKIVKKISQHLNDMYKPEGILINQNNGKRAGQEILHAHIHIKPIYEDTQTLSEVGLRKSFTKEDMEKYVKELSLI
jgi:histidine triad (HIT) family protein